MTGVRCLALMSDDTVKGVQDGPDFEVTSPWTRMNGRNWWGGTLSKRLRTAPRAFQTTFRQRQ